MYIVRVHRKQHHPPSHRGCVSIPPCVFCPRVSLFLHLLACSASSVLSPEAWGLSTDFSSLIISWHIFNLSWQTQPRTNGRFIARLAGSNMYTPSTLSDSSRTPSTLPCLHPRLYQYISWLMRCIFILASIRNPLLQRSPCPHDTRLFRQYLGPS